MKPALSTALLSFSYPLLPQINPLWNNTSWTFWMYSKVPFVALIASAVVNLRYRKFQPRLGGLDYTTSWGSCDSFCLQRGLEHVANSQSSNLNYSAREVVPDTPLSPGLVGGRWTTEKLLRTSNISISWLNVRWWGLCCSSAREKGDSCSYLPSV